MLPTMYATCIYMCVPTVLVVLCLSNMLAHKCSHAHHANPLQTDVYSQRWDLNDETSGRGELLALA